MSCTPGAGPSRFSPSGSPDLRHLTLQSHTTPSDSPSKAVGVHDSAPNPIGIEDKPPLVTAYSAPPVLQSEIEGIREGFTFGTCPSTSFLGTPAAEKGPFEYPDFSQSASSSRRPSLADPAIRRGSSSSSTASTVTALSTATRRPSLAPLPLSSDLPAFQSSAQARRRGSLFHFQTKPVAAPIPPSLLARRGSLPAAEAIFGLPFTERRQQLKNSVSGVHVAPHSPPTLTSPQPSQPTSPIQRRSSLRVRLPDGIAARRGSLPTSPAHPIYPSQPMTSDTEISIRDHSRQSTSTNSSRGSLLSHSSLISEDAIKDDDESTDQDTAADVETPGSSSETESMGLFRDPWCKDDGRIDGNRCPSGHGAVADIAATFR